MAMVTWENYKTQTVKHDYRVEIEVYTGDSVRREIYAITAESISEALKKVARLYDDYDLKQAATMLIVRVQNADEPAKYLYQRGMVSPPELSHTLRWFAVCAAQVGL